LKLAAIDIGSNSIKVVVVEATASDSFKVLASDRQTVRLGQETLVNKHISDAAMLRATDCLRRFRLLAEDYGTEEIAAIATAFLREADNANEFIRIIEEQTGLRVRLLSGLEEARLIGLAASHGCTEKNNPNIRDSTTLNIDIGGGSTEISIFRGDEPLILRSINIGAVGLTDRFIRANPPAPHELDALRTEIRVSFDDAVRELREYSWTLATATSGTATTIGVALSHIMPPASTTVTFAQLKDLVAKLAALTIAERRNVAGIPAERADIIVAGGVILEEVMSALGIESLRTCDWSLREGVIIDRLRASMTRITSEQIDSV
jgi:exopolyphosphatase/guanosine-5'-triphosphate,3'-diphosphate pyrophosphatase